MSAITANASRKMKKYAVLTREPRCFIGSLDFSWEQRKLEDVVEFLDTIRNIPVISVHGLRHTHASLLLFTGVSIASVARRLGHSSMTTTQKTYLHIIQELENKDIDLVMRSLSGLS